MILQYSDELKLFRRLEASAESHGLQEKEHSGVPDIGYPEPRPFYAHRASEAGPHTDDVLGLDALESANKLVCGDSSMSLLVSENSVAINPSDPKYGSTLFALDSAPGLPEAGSNSSLTVSDACVASDWLEPLPLRPLRVSDIEVVMFDEDTLSPLPLDLSGLTRGM